MSFEVYIERDSIGPSGVRLTTFVLKYPRFIHAELMTHRVFSRNASSSRAIPVTTMMKRIKEDPAMPIHWGKNQKGMQAYEEHDYPEIGEELWTETLDLVLKQANKLALAGFHKQIVNRILEPWSHIHVVLTATDFANWFALRNHHMAQPEIKRLAEIMWHAYEFSTPKKLTAGQWHLPFITQSDSDGTDPYLFESVENLIYKSVARCARVSYMKHDGTQSSLEEDKVLYDRLLSSQPIHASPAEHQAMAVGDPNVRSGNLRGWIQYRKTLTGENITKYNGPEEESE